MIVEACELEPGDVLLRDGATVENVGPHNGGYIVVLRPRGWKGHECVRAVYEGWFEARHQFEIAERPTN